MTTPFDHEWPIDLRVTERDWRGLRKLFAPSFRSPLAPETGAIGVVSEVSAPGKQEFLLTKVFWPQPGDLKVTEHQAVVFDASYIRRAHLFMREHKLGGIAIFHTHPMSDMHVGFSPYDDYQEPVHLANLRELAPSTQLISVVAGEGSQKGRVWRGSPKAGAEEPRTLRDLVIVGDRLEFQPLSGEPTTPPASPSAIFDRAMQLTGAGALARLETLAIAVVGASGTGSIVCELLARAGCKHMMLIDDDVVKDVNLNRVLHSTQADVDGAVPKVEVIHRAIEGLGLGCSIEPIVGNVLDRSILARVREADVIFGCVDRAYPRLLLSELSYRFLRPYIDVGSEIGGDASGIVCLDARTNYVAPGRPCLSCTGLVTGRQLSFESLSYAERQRVIRQGYSDDLLLKQPAVMELNMRAASYGMMVLRHLLQPFLLAPLPVTISENLVTYATLPIAKAKAFNESCPVCQRNQFVGFGDCGPPIGLSSGDVQRITQPASWPGSTCVNRNSVSPDPCTSSGIQPLTSGGGRNHSATRRQTTSTNSWPCSA